MKTKIVIPLLLALLAVLLACSFTFTTADAPKKKNPAIEAFKAHPKVVEIMKVQKASGKDISFESILISSQSGVAGVSTQELVVMHISSPLGQVNPSTRSIMGTVEGITPFNDEFRVSSFVELKPIEEAQVK